MYLLVGYRRASFPKAEGCGDAEDVFQLRVGGASHSVTFDYFFVPWGYAAAGDTNFAVWLRLRDNDVDRVTTIKKEDFTQLTLLYLRLTLVVEWMGFCVKILILPVT